MADAFTFDEVGSHGYSPHVQSGPLLDDILSNAGASIGDYVRAGGYEVARNATLRSPLEVIQTIDEAGLRGRGGGGFPTGHKWKLVAESESPERYFICNANASQPGGTKERFLIQASPHRVLESMLLAAHAISATAAIICLPQHLERETALLENALEEATTKSIAGRNGFGATRRPNIFICQTPTGYISGEETALMELIEGRVAQPRGKPPMPTAHGLFGAPTVVTNLETLLHVYHIVKYGADQFRK